jgi:hypothetical protein
MFLEYHSGRTQRVYWIYFAWYYSNGVSLAPDLHTGNTVLYVISKRMLKPVANKLSHFKCLVFVLLTLSGQQPLFADFNINYLFFSLFLFWASRKSAPSQCLNSRYKIIFHSFSNSNCSRSISVFVGFTKHYRAADGGQPAVIRVRKWCLFLLTLGQKNICGFPVSRPYLAFGRRNPDPKLFYWIMLVSVST